MDMMWSQRCSTAGDLEFAGGQAATTIRDTRYLYPGGGGGPGSLSAVGAVRGHHATQPIRRSGG